MSVSWSGNWPLRHRHRRSLLEQIVTGVYWGLICGGAWTVATMLDEAGWL